MRSAIMLAIVCLLAGCGAYPADQSGTSERIERNGQIRVGLTAIDPRDASVAKAFLERVANSTRAKVVSSTGPTEKLLAEVETGDLDIILGEFAEDSPWLADVALIEPLTRRVEGDRVVGLAPVVANGENQWVGSIESVVRDVKLAPKDADR